MVAVVVGAGSEGHVDVARADLASTFSVSVQWAYTTPAAAIISARPTMRSALFFIFPSFPSGFYVPLSPAPSRGPGQPSSRRAPRALPKEGPDRFVVYGCGWFEKPTQLARLHSFQFTSSMANRTWYVVP